MAIAVPEMASSALAPYVNCDIARLSRRRYADQPPKARCAGRQIIPEQPPEQSAFQNRHPPLQPQSVIIAKGTAMSAREFINDTLLPWLELKSGDRPHECAVRTLLLG
ncbi:MAG TPA: hypothetical protein VKU02_04955 [Gemmataceae bacterium]|nr:hypothetical protein [Gemmataceae bacterium]